MMPKDWLLEKIEDPGISVIVSSAIAEEYLSCVD